MHVSGGPFTNFAGTTLTGGTYNITGTLKVDELGSAGGEIVTNAANIILNGTTSSFVDSASKDALKNLKSNGTGSAFTISGGRNFTVVGNFTNNGTLAVRSGSTFAVPAGFSLTNFSGTTLTGGTYNVAGTLQFAGANIVTNAANIALTGTSGKILNSTTSANALANFATNAGSFAINGGANFTTAGAFMNNGNLIVGSGSTFNSMANYTNTGASTAQTGGTFNEKGTLSGSGAFTNGGTLEVVSGNTMDLKASVANNGGTILATGIGSQALLDGSTISGGTLTSNSGGVLVAENSATLNGSTSAVKISTGSALQVNNGQTLQVKGTITNSGGLTLNSTGSITKLLLTGNTTLGGGGTLTLSNNAANVISATASTDVLSNSSTIQGSGNIGNGQMGLVNNNAILANQSTPLKIDSSSAGFNNKGTLTVNIGDTLNITGVANSFLNFNGTTGTLTGGTYIVNGTLQFDNANIKNNAANITLSGTTSKITDQVGTINALANLAANSGSFSLSGNQNLTTAGSLANSGTLKVASGSTLTLGSSGTYTQTAGTTTVDGTLKSTVTTSALNLNGGSLLGTGTLGFGVVDGGTLTPADSSTVAGKLAVLGTYKQSSGGVLNIAIGGTTAGTQYDQLNVTGAATVNGTVNLSLISGFVPALGNTFDILTAGSVSGTFSTVNGMHINGSEHFVVSCDTTDCDVTVASGPSVVVQASLAGPTYSATTPGLLSPRWRSSLNPNWQSSSMPTISTPKKQGVVALAVSAREPSSILMTDGICGGLRTFTSLSCITKAISGVTNSAGMHSAPSQGTLSSVRRDDIAIASTVRTSGGGGASHMPSEPTIAAASRLYFCSYVPSSLAHTMGCR
jgi:hypothetical protein